MKPIIATLLLTVLSCSAFSQVTIPYSDLTGAAKPAHTIKLENGKENWQDAAVIDVTGIAAGGAASVTVISTKGNVSSASRDGGATLHYALNDLIEKQGVLSFDVQFNGVTIQTITFTLADKVFYDPTKNTNDPLEAFISGIATANFTGENKFLSNLTPVVNLGASKQFTEHWEVEISPYIGSQIDGKSKSAYLAAMMLPGKLGITINNYLRYKILKDNAVLVIMPLGIGGKYISALGDPGSSIVQHNIRFGLGVTVPKFAAITGQYTHGWHNLITAYQKSFYGLFGNMATDIDYVNVTAQVPLKASTDNVESFLFLEWRSFLSTKRFSAFDNVSILTLGYRKSLALGSTGGYSANTKTKSKAPRNRQPFNL